MEKLLHQMGAYSLALPLACMGLLTFLSSLPGEPESDALLVFGMSVEIEPTIHNLIHVPAYLVLGLCWLLAFEALRWPPGRATGWTILLGIGFGCLDELHQAFVPYRYPGLLDILSNATGILLACGLWRLTRPWLIPSSRGAQ